MLNGVNDVLTPWTPARILRIMESASATTTAGRGSSDRATTGAAEDGTLALEKLLRLSNQQPDVAGRVMAAPVFAQRPLVEAAESGPKSTAATSSSPPPPPSPFYVDAHRMCTHTLQVCRPGWRDVQQDHASATAATASASPPPATSAPMATATSPNAVATELEEVAFAAEFAEPCLRGAFPDVAAVARHTLPLGCTSLLDGTLREDFETSEQRRARNANVAHRVLQSLLQEPAVSHRKPAERSEDEADPTPSPPPSSSLRLNLTRPIAPPPPPPPPPGLLWPSLPPPSAVPIEAYGPPGHKLFDNATVSHTFTKSEMADLQAYLCVKPRPFEVYSHAQVQARRQQSQQYERRSAMLSAGAGAARIVGPGSSSASAATGRHGRERHGGQHGVRAEDDGQDGWSASSGWSSSRSNSRSASPPRDRDDADATANKSVDVPQDTDATETAEKVAEAAADNSTAANPQQPQLNRTWVEDDGDLVFVNGKVMIRKRKTRAQKNQPPPLPLPTVVKGPGLRVPAQSAQRAGTAATEVKDDETPSGPSTKESDAATETTKDEAELKVESRRDEEDKEKNVPGPIEGSSGKRRRAANESDEEKDEQSASPSAGQPRKRSKLQANAKKASRKGSAPSSSAATVSTADVPRLSENAMLRFIDRLSISDVLRHALLIGVQATPANSKKDDAEEEDSDNAGSSL